MNDSDLDRLLRTWSAPEVPPDDFRRGVWQRIAAHSEAPGWLRWLDPLLRPRLALTSIAVALIAGAAAGSAHAALKIKAAPVASADSAAVYVESINPLDPGHPRHAEQLR